MLMTRVRGEIWSINLTLQGAEDQGATAGLLPGSNLDLGVEAGIERGIHDMRLLWEYHSQGEDWGFLFID